MLLCGLITLYDWRVSDRWPAVARLVCFFCFVKYTSSLWLYLHVLYFRRKHCGRPRRRMNIVPLHFDGKLCDTKRAKLNWSFIALSLACHAIGIKYMRFNFDRRVCVNVCGVRSFGLPCDCQRRCQLDETKETSPKQRLTHVWNFRSNAQWDTQINRPIQAVAAFSWH